MWSFSQTIYPKLLNDSLIVITAKQLKQTNKIFLEHSKLKETNFEMVNQISNYNKLLINYEKIDSLQKAKISACITAVDNLAIKNSEQATKIDKLMAKNKYWKKWTVGGFALSFALVLLILSK